MDKQVKSITVKYSDGSTLTVTDRDFEIVVAAIKQFADQLNSAAQILKSEDKR